MVAILDGDRDLAERVRAVSLAVYTRAAEHARERGIILADTKFELGLDADGTLTLGDEVLTPDSIALLAGRRLRTGSSPAELRQAVRARTGPRRAAGTEYAACSADPRRSRRSDAGLTGRHTSGSPASRSKPGLSAPARSSSGRRCAPTSASRSCRWC